MLLLKVLNRTMAGEHIRPRQAPAVKLSLAYSTEFKELEIDVLLMLSAGCSDEETARQQMISAATLCSHIGLMRKNGCTLPDGTCAARASLRCSILNVSNENARLRGAVHFT